MGRPNPSGETKFSCTNGDMDILTSSFHLTTSRIGNLTRLIHTPLYVMTILIVTVSLFVQMIQHIYLLCPLLIHVTQLLSASINSRAPPEEIAVL